MTRFFLVLDFSWLTLTVEHDASRSSALSAEHTPGWPEMCCILGVSVYGSDYSISFNNFHQQPREGRLDLGFPPDVIDVWTLLEDNQTLHLTGSSPTNGN